MTDYIDQYVTHMDKKTITLKLSKDFQTELLPHQPNMQTDQLRTVGEN